MVLSDKDIRGAIHLGDIVVDVENNASHQLDIQAHGIDLTVGKIETVSGRVLLENRLRPYKIRPREVVIIETYESIGLSKKYAATVHTLATLSLRGSIGISTTIHPGWPNKDLTGKDRHSRISVAFVNISQYHIPLSKGDKFCRLLIHETSSEPDRRAPSIEDVTRSLQEIRNDIAKQKSKKRNLFILAFIIFITAAIVIFMMASKDSDLIITLLATLIGTAFGSLLVTAFTYSNWRL